MSEGRVEGEGEGEGLERPEGKSIRSLTVTLYVVGSGIDCIMQLSCLTCAPHLCASRLQELVGTVNEATQRVVGATQRPSYLRLSDAVLASRHCGRA